jgi:transcriptional regulator with XRE-family HTH domain
MTSRTRLEGLMTLSEKLKEARDTAGITQEALARACDLSLSAVRDFERGKKEPSLRNAVKIADALGVSVEAFAEAVRGPLPSHYLGRRLRGGRRLAGGRLKSHGAGSPAEGVPPDRADTPSADG